MVNKLWLGLGAITTVVVPIVAVVSCSNNDGKFPDELIHTTSKQSPDNKDHYYLIKSFKNDRYSGGFGGSIEISEQYYKELGGK